MKSILQDDKERCFLCGGFGNYSDPLDEHHVFFGPYRKNAEKYGLKVYLHHFRCHIFGEHAVHVDADVCREIQKQAQSLAMAKFGLSTDDFIRLFGRNLL